MSGRGASPPARPRPHARNLCATGGGRMARHTHPQRHAIPPLPLAGSGRQPPRRRRAGAHVLAGRGVAWGSAGASPARDRPGVVAGVVAGEPASCKGRPRADGLAGAVRGRAAPGLPRRRPGSDQGRARSRARAARHLPRRRPEGRTDLGGAPAHSGHSRRGAHGFGVRPRVRTNARARLARRCAILGVDRRAVRLPRTPVEGPVGLYAFIPVFGATYWRGPL